jgi:transformation/transcription domain-associated protein
MCSKLTQACIESICNKGDRPEAISVLQGVLLTTVEKLKAIYRAFDRMKEATTLEKGKTKPVDEEQLGRTGYDAYDWRSIERSMPVLTVAYASDSLDTFVRGMRMVS